MPRKLYYCKSWFMAKKHVTEPWSEAQAKAAHDAGQPYRVLVDSIERPFCVITVTHDFIAVEFLDQLLRPSLQYHFEEIERGKLFMIAATHREFVAETDSVARGTNYFFKPDGSVRIQREQLVPVRKVEEAKSHEDLSANFASFPEFGHYDDLIAVERR